MTHSDNLGNFILISLLCIEWPLRSLQIGSGTYSGRIRVREDQKQSRDVGVRDPHFCAVQQVVGAVLFGLCFQSESIRSGNRLRQAKATRLKEALA